MSMHYDRMIESILGSLEVGCPIFTADGEQIGTLAEVRSQHLKVDAPMRRDYWIDASNVRVCDGKRIELTFNNDDLRAYQAGDPGHPNVQTETLGDPHPLADGTVLPGQFASTAMPGPQADRSNPDPLVGQKNDLVVSESQQMEARMRMEGGLVEQRDKLAHTHPIGEDAPPDTIGTLGEPVESELARLEQERAPVDRQTFGVKPERSPSRSFMETARELPHAAVAGVKAVRKALTSGLRELRAAIARITSSSRP